MLQRKLTSLKTLLIKYKHAWVFSYFIFYLICFSILEKSVSRFHIIYSPIDEHIPFLEGFVIPYMLWFPYIGLIFVYFFFKDIRGFNQMCIFFFSGMTIFLIVSAIYPNGLLIRPTVFPRDNICTDIVKYLYSIDTATNVLPSIHVFNSIGAYIAIARSKEFKHRPLIRYSSFALSALIILSTMFIKQHSFIDVASGCILACILYFAVYERGSIRVFNEQLSPKEER